MKYKKGDIVYRLEWVNDSRDRPRAKVVKCRITELVEDFRSAPYIAKGGGWRGQYHGREIDPNPNEMRARAIEFIEGLKNEENNS